jgi:hypothetical protein
MTRISLLIFFFPFFPRAKSSRHKKRKEKIREEAEKRLDRPIRRPGTM